MATTPSLLLPADGAVARLQSLVFNWVRADAGGTHILEISDSNSFAHIIQQVATSLTQADTIFPAGGVYYWRVRAGANISDVRSFSAPAFSPATIQSHVADGKARVLNQFREDA